MSDANYRKLNDGSHSSSTYHKKDGTPVRAILKRELRSEVDILESNFTNGFITEQEDESDDEEDD